MRNAEVADLLEELADYLDVQGETWEPRAYRKAARNLRELQDPVEELHAQGRLGEVEGVGKAIQEKVAQVLETGRMEALEREREGFPVDVPALLSVQGLGPKGVAKLHEHLGITTLGELEAAAREGELTSVPGFGKKTQQRVLEEVSFVKAARERTLMAPVLEAGRALVAQLQATGGFDRVAVAGSVRRRLPTVGNLDLVATAPGPDQERAPWEDLEDLESITQVRVRAEDHVELELARGLRAHLHLVPEEAWGAGLVWWTGSVPHGQALEARAAERGWRLTPHGLLEANGGLVACGTEEAVYGALGLGLVPPELREGRGEVQAAADGTLPELVRLEDIRGDLQMHTTWSDGRTSIEQMAHKAEALGYGYILITDHGPSLTVAGGPTEDEMPEQAAEIARVNERVGIQVLHGCEANITADGIDISEQACRELDLVVASLHDSVADATERVVHALEAYPVDVFAHPTNRLLGRRQGNALDMEAIVAACKANRVAIEINAQPNRLDLDWQEVARYKGEVRFILSTDAHSPAGMEHMHLAVSQARKGWLEVGDVLNAQPLEALLGYLRG